MVPKTYLTAICDFKVVPGKTQFMGNVWKE